MEIIIIILILFIGIPVFMGMAGDALRKRAIEKEKEKKKPKLINCANCGKPVSSAVDKCPHCNKNPEKEHMCGICGKSISAFDHTSCRKSYWDNKLPDKDRQEFSCPTCHKVYRYDKHVQEVREDDDGYWHTSYCFTCLSCGQSIKFFICDNCGGFCINDDREYRYHVSCYKFVKKLRK